MKSLNKENISKEKDRRYGGISKFRIFYAVEWTYPGPIWEINGEAVQEELLREGN